VSTDSSFHSLTRNSFTWTERLDRSHVGSRKGASGYYPSSRPARRGNSLHRQGMQKRHAQVLLVHGCSIERMRSGWQFSGKTMLERRHLRSATLHCTRKVSNADITSGLPEPARRIHHQPDVVDVRLELPLLLLLLPMSLCLDISSSYLLLVYFLPPSSQCTPLGS
jgi:hypothetical protein